VQERHSSPKGCHELVQIQPHRPSDNIREIYQMKTTKIVLPRTPSLLLTEALKDLIKDLRALGL
jgi:hypothetical protein